MNDDQIIDIFCNVDDFMLTMHDKSASNLLSSNKCQRHRETKLSNSEIMTIMILFHRSGYRTFKHFYLRHVQCHWRHYFPYLLSYTRFVALLPRIIAPLCAFLRSRLGTCTGISFVDSTKVAVCHPKRIRANRVFKNIAKIGRTTTGWFFGFKLHLVVNDNGELLSMHFTPGNVDDRSPLDMMTGGVFGKIFGDKGYISQDLSQLLMQRGLQLVTNVKKNMKNKLMPLIDKILLRKRSIIETINDQLKNISQIEHSRHRSTANFAINLLAGLVAYTFQPKKPRINMAYDVGNMLLAA